MKTLPARIDAPFDSGDYPASVLLQTGGDMALSYCDQCHAGAYDWPTPYRHFGKPGAMYQAALYCADCMPQSYDADGQLVQTLTGY